MASELFYLIVCQMGRTPTKKDLLLCLRWSNSIIICSVVISLEYLQFSDVLISTGSAWTSLPVEVDQTLSRVECGLATCDYSPAVL